MNLRDIETTIKQDSCFGEGGWGLGEEGERVERKVSWEFA